MGRRVLKVTVLALAVVSLLPMAAFPVAAAGSTGKEQPAPKEKDQPGPKEKDKEPKEPEKEVPDDTRTERDGPPRQKPTPVPPKTPRTVVVGKSAPSPVYSYRAGANYCPAGLEPVSIAGEVSCGTPNQPRTYQQMLAHPKPAPTRHRSARPKSYYQSSACGVGMKGCSDR